MKDLYISNVSKEKEIEISLRDESKKQVMIAEWNFPQLYTQM